GRLRLAAVGGELDIRGRLLVRIELEHDDRRVGFGNRRLDAIAPARGVLPVATGEHRPHRKEHTGHRTRAHPSSIGLPSYPLAVPCGARRGNHSTATRCPRPTPSTTEVPPSGQPIRKSAD